MFKYKITLDFFDALLRETVVNNPKFVKYLMDNQEFSMKKTPTLSGFVTNYEVSYNGQEYINEDGIKMKPFRGSRRMMAS